MIAHEIAHNVIRANPQMQAIYHLPNFPPNAAEVDTDLKKRGIPKNEKHIRYQSYKNELLADNIEIRLTHDPASAASMLRKTKKNLDASEQQMQAALSRRIALVEEAEGYKITPEQKKRLESNLRGPDINRDNPHPDTELRINAMNEQMKKIHEHEMPLKRLMHGLENLVHPKPDKPIEQQR